MHPTHLSNLSGVFMIFPSILSPKCLTYGPWRPPSSHVCMNSTDFLGRVNCGAAAGQGLEEDGFPLHQIPPPNKSQRSSGCFLSKLMSEVWSLHGSSLNANLPKKPQETLFCDILWRWSYLSAKPWIIRLLLFATREFDDFVQLLEAKKDGNPRAHKNEGVFSHLLAK